MEGLDAKRRRCVAEPLSYQEVRDGAVEDLACELRGMRGCYINIYKCVPVNIRIMSGITGLESVNRNSN